MLLQTNFPMQRIPQPNHQSCLNFGSSEPWNMPITSDKYPPHQPSSTVRERRLEAYIPAVSPHIRPSFSFPPFEPPIFVREVQTELKKQRKAAFKSCLLILDFRASEASKHAHTSATLHTVAFAMPGRRHPASVLAFGDTLSLLQYPRYNSCL